MKQEDKRLLLQDLCARLPYGIKALCEDEVVFVKACNDDTVYVEFEGASIIVDEPIDEVKPYLFTLSNNTEEQKEYLRQNQILIAISTSGIVETTTEGFDWLNKNHIDYRGLIGKGLAINATGLNIY